LQALPVLLLAYAGISVRLTAGIRTSLVIFDHSGLVGCQQENDELALNGFWSFVGFAGHFFYK
jgi:hypothetical protein